MQEPVLNPFAKIFQFMNCTSSNQARNVQNETGEVLSQPEIDQQSSISP